MGQIHDIFITVGDKKEPPSSCYHDAVPLQPTNIWDNGLAALRHFGQIYVNIVQKATTFFRTILAFTVQIMVPKPAKTEATSDTLRR